MENKHVDYWINLSNYDLDIAEAVYEKKYYLHCGFMCHQSIEKLFKAMFVQIKKTTPPKTHNLDKIITECGREKDFTEEQYNFIDELTPLNIQARYPAYKEMLLKMIDKKKAFQILQKTKEMHKWVKEKMNWKIK